MESVPALSLAERDRRWGLARELMRRTGVDALIVYGDREAGAPAAFNVDGYFTNDRLGSIVLFVRDEAPTVLTFASMMIADHLQARYRGDTQWIEPDLRRSRTEYQLPGDRPQRLAPPGGGGDRSGGGGSGVLGSGAADLAGIRLGSARLGGSTPRTYRRHLHVTGADRVRNITPRSCAAMTIKAAATVDIDVISADAPESPASEYENEPVPPHSRRSLLSVAAVWLGFPMILTCAVFGGLIVYSLGFWRGMLAIALGNAVLTAYVGALSYLAGKTGKNFGLTAIETFGRGGYRVVCGFLATVVIGWFAFQTGLTGSVLATCAGWDARWTALAAGVGYVAVTLVGIRALSAIGLIAAPLYLLLGITAIVLALRDSTISDAVEYRGGAGVAAMSMGAAVTLVVACFIDSGTMTADFTRWSRNGRQGFWASVAAFPIGNCAAMVVGGVIVALGAARSPATDGGNFLGTLIDTGGWLVPVSIVFVFVNLGSVCTHCLYNGAVGWSQLTGHTMRLLAVLLGAAGVLLAVLGVWSHFEQWLTLLGVVVPPIGTVLILDQLVLPRFGIAVRDAAIRWESFGAWAAGAASALAAHLWAPQLSDALTGIAAAALVYLAAARGARRGLPA